MVMAGLLWAMMRVNCIDVTQEGKRQYRNT
jgi:hypothetical protein